MSGLTQFGPALEAHIREDNKLSTLEMTNVVIPRNNGPAALLVYIRDAQEANRILRKGALVEGSWYPATAFVSNGNLSQCERCWRFGHRAKYCQSSERCRRRGSSARTMTTCKVKAGKCVNCGKGHYASSTSDSAGSNIVVATPHPPHTHHDVAAPSLGVTHALQRFELHGTPRTPSISSSTRSRSRIPTPDGRPVAYVRLRIAPNAGRSALA